MSKGGVFIVLIFTSKDGRVLSNSLPHIFTYGFINIQKNKDLIREWKLKILRSIEGERDNLKVKNNVMECVSAIFSNESRQEKPETLVIVEKS